MSEEKQNKGIHWLIPGEVQDIVFPVDWAVEEYLNDPSNFEKLRKEAKSIMTMDVFSVVIQGLINAQKDVIAQAGVAQRSEDTARGAIVGLTRFQEIVTNFAAAASATDQKKIEFDKHKAL